MSFTLESELIVRVAQQIEILETNLLHNRIYQTLAVVKAYLSSSSALPSVTQSSLNETG